MATWTLYILVAKGISRQKSSRTLVPRWFYFLGYHQADSSEGIQEHTLRISKAFLDWVQEKNRKQRLSFAATSYFP